MSILPALQSAALRILGVKPNVFFNSGEQFEQELADLSNDVMRIVMREIDWQALTKIHSIMGDSSTEEFPFPDDYDRQSLDSQLQDMQNWAWGYAHIQSLNDYLSAKAIGFGPFPGIWTIYSNKFHFYPAPMTGNTASFPYQSRNYAIDGDTQQPKALFTKDNDECVLPKELLTLGLIWRWRENKGEPLRGEQEAFRRALSQYAAKDSGSVVFRSTSYNTFPGVNIAWPWPLG